MNPAALRRATHTATATILFLPFALEWRASRLVVVGLAAAWTLIELVRIRVPAVHNGLAKVQPVFRENERTRVSGAGWLMIGYGIAIWFSPAAATVGILVAALADPAASAIGSRFSRGGAKTWAGSVAFFGVAITICLVVGLEWPTAVLPAVAGTLVERWSFGMNDNLVIAPVVAGTVTLLA